MTPPAATSAGREAAARNGNGQRRNATPRPVRGGSIPRRVSGPAGGRAGSAAGGRAQTAGAGGRGQATTARGATAQAGTARVAPRPAPRVAPRPRPRAVPRRPARHQPLIPRLADGALTAVRGVPDHRWLDRLVRGRAWIPVLGILLAGIVATQVEVLKLGASEGRWMSRTAALSARNQTLQASVAALSDDQRIERLASRMGMVMPAPTAITFLNRPHPGGVRAAMARMRAPDATQFESNLQTTGG